MYKTVNGTEIYIEVRGKGRPLIMVHGNGEDHHIFDRASMVLKDHFTCYMPDSRGHGRSGKVTVYHYQDMADDMVALMEELNLENVAFYGFSDGGITGLLAAMKTDRITDLVISGANLEPDGVKLPFFLMTGILGKLFKDERALLMANEPHITDRDLAKIRCRTLVLAGDHDLIRRKHTQKIAENIRGARLRIVRNASHGSYIVGSEKIAMILLKWLGRTE